MALFNRRKPPSPSATVSPHKKTTSCQRERHFPEKLSSINFSSSLKPKGTHNSQDGECNASSTSCSQCDARENGNFEQGHRKGQNMSIISQGTKPSRHSINHLAKKYPQSCGYQKRIKNRLQPYVTVESEKNKLETEEDKLGSHHDDPEKRNIPIIGFISAKDLKREKEKNQPMNIPRENVFSHQDVSHGERFYSARKSDSMERKAKNHHPSDCSKENESYCQRQERWRVRKTATHRKAQASKNEKNAEWRVDIRNWINVLPEKKKRKLINRSTSIYPEHATSEEGNSVFERFMSNSVLTEDSGDGLLISNMLDQIVTTPDSTEVGSLEVILALCCLLHGLKTRQYDVEKKLLENSMNHYMQSSKFAYKHTLPTIEVTDLVILASCCLLLGLKTRRYDVEKKLLEFRRVYDFVHLRQERNGADGFFDELFPGHQMFSMKKLSILVEYQFKSQYEIATLPGKTGEEPKETSLSTIFGRINSVFTKELDLNGRPYEKSIFFRQQTVKGDLQSPADNHQTKHMAHIVELKYNLPLVPSYDSPMIINRYGNRRSDLSASYLYDRTGQQSSAQIPVTEYAESMERTNQISNYQHSNRNIEEKEDTPGDAEENEEVEEEEVADNFQENDENPATYKQFDMFTAKDLMQVEALCIILQTVQQNSAGFHRWHPVRVSLTFVQIMPICPKATVTKIRKKFSVTSLKPLKIIRQFENDQSEDKAFLKKAVQIADPINASQITETNNAGHIADPKIAKTNNTGQIAKGQNAKLNNAGQNAEINNAGQNAETNDTGQIANTNNAGQNAKINNAGQNTEINNAGQNAETNDTGQVAETNDTGQNAHTHNAGQISDPNDTGQDAETNDTGQVAETNDTGQFAHTHNAGQIANTNNAGQNAEINNAGQNAEINNAGQVADTNNAGQIAHTHNAGQNAEINNAGQNADTNNACQNAEINNAGQIADTNNAGQIANTHNAGQNAEINNAGQNVEINNSGQIADTNNAGHIFSDQIAEINNAGHIAETNNADQIANTNNSGRIANTNNASQIAEMNNSGQISDTNNASQIAITNNAGHIIDTNNAGQIKELMLHKVECQIVQREDDRQLEMLKDTENENNHNIKALCGSKHESTLVRLYRNVMQNETYRMMTSIDMVVSEAKHLFGVERTRIFFDILNDELLHFGSTGAISTFIPNMTESAVRQHVISFFEHACDTMYRMMTLLLGCPDSKRIQQMPEPYFISLLQSVIDSNPQKAKAKEGKWISSKETKESRFIMTESEFFERALREIPEECLYRVACGDKMVLCSSVDTKIKENGLSLCTHFPSDCRLFISIPTENGSYWNKLDRQRASRISRHVSYSFVSISYNPMVSKCNILYCREDSMIWLKCNLHELSIDNFKPPFDCHDCYKVPVPLEEKEKVRRNNKFFSKL